MSTHRVATLCDFRSVGIMPAGPFVDHPRTARKQVPIRAAARQTCVSSVFHSGAVQQPAC